jgi:hypothetical protein
VDVGSCGNKLMLSHLVSREMMVYTKKKNDIIKAEHAHYELAIKLKKKICICAMHVPCTVNIVWDTLKPTFLNHNNL